MKIIADSGSTKTAWVDAARGERFDTEGLNPLFTTDEAFLAACAQAKAKLMDNRKSATDKQLQVYFYGAGCGQPRQQRRVAKLLSQAFGTDDVHVETDMLGACRAVSPDKYSVVAILGTGSNTCIYDGTRITHQPTSTGYVLGDRGSANHVGRLMLDEYLTHRMPLDRRKLFHDTFRMSDAQLIDAVYNKPNPNRFLGWLAVLAVDQMDDEYFVELIVKAIDDWYNYCFAPLILSKTKLLLNWDLNVRFVGGFAKAIEVVLAAYFMQNDCYGIAPVVTNPLEGLCRYHNQLHP